MVHTFLLQQHQLSRSENRAQSYRNFNLSTLTYQVKEWDHNHLRLVAQLHEDEKDQSKIALKKNFFGSFHEIPTVSTRRYWDGLVLSAKHVMMRR